MKLTSFEKNCHILRRSLTTTICTGNDPNLVYACIDDICHLRQLLFLIDNKLIL
jgi:hypothetical protein